MNTKIEYILLYERCDFRLWNEQDVGEKKLGEETVHL